MADRIPPIRPRLAIGVGSGGDVAMSPPFMRWLDIVRNAINATVAVPTGTLRTSLNDGEPAGWKKLNGQALSKTNYADLYDLIGDTFGATVDTFNLPDATNRVLIGAGTIALAQYGGASSVTLTTDNLPAHSHAVTDPAHGHAVTDPGHTHGVTDPGHSHTSGEVDTAKGAAGTASDGAISGSTSANTTGVTVDSATTGVSVDSNTTGITLGDTGGGQAFSILPLGMGVTVLVKT